MRVKQARKRQPFGLHGYSYPQPCLEDTPCLLFVRVSYTLAIKHIDVADRWLHIDNLQ